MLNNDLKRFIKSFVIILMLVYIADFAIGEYMAYLYREQSSGLFYRTTYALDSTRADYLVLGSSRANHHYDSKVFEKELNVSFYNCGRDGQNIIYSCAVAAAVMHRYHPKFLIIDITPNEFTTPTEGKLSALLPYYDNIYVRPYLEYNSHVEQYKLLSHIYPYNSDLTSLLVGRASFNKKRTADYAGYMPLQGSTVSAVMPVVTEGQKVDTAKVNCLKNTLIQLDKAQIPTLVILSPLHGAYKDGPTVHIATRLCCLYHHIKFLNFAHDSICTEGKYFHDDGHLNEDGAKLFSTNLIRSIKTLKLANGRI